MGGGNVGDPVTHGLADGIFQSAAAARDRHDFRAEQSHAKNVEALTAHVFFAHVDRAIKSEQSADCGGGNAVLACPRFRDDTFLSHASREQRLADAVIYFMGAGVEQVFALNVDLRAATE